MSNKEVVSLEGVVKSDSSVEQKVYFVRGFQRRSWVSIKGRLFVGSIGFRGGSIVYFVRGENCWGLLRGNPTLANLGNDHGFISKEYFSIDMRPFGGPQSKAMRAYTPSGQYHTIVVSILPNEVWQSKMKILPQESCHVNKSKFW